MTRSSLKLITATAVFLAFAPAASAQVGVFMWMDREIKKSIKEARSTPGHVRWCARNHAGYVVKWNHYKDSNGRVRYCASPFYTPPWQRPFASR